MNALAKSLLHGKLGLSLLILRKITVKNGHNGFTMVPNQDVLDLKRLAVATVRHSIALVFGRSVLRTCVPFSVLLGLLGLLGLPS